MQGSIKVARWNTDTQEGREECKEETGSEGEGRAGRREGRKGGMGQSCTFLRLIKVRLPLEEGQSYRPWQKDKPAPLRSPKKSFIEIDQGVMRR